MALNNPVSTVLVVVASLSAGVAGFAPGPHAESSNAAARPMTPETPAGMRFMNTAAPFKA
jgi:hypothetical protein